MTEKTGLAAQHMENCTVTPDQEEGVWLYRVQVTNGSAVLGNEALDASLDTDASSQVGLFSLPLPEAGAMTAVYQHKTWWLRPAFVSGPEQVPERTQLLLWQQKGEYWAAVTVCDGVLRGDFSGETGGVTLSLSANGCPADSNSHIVAAVHHGADPYVCIKEMVAAVCRRLGKTHMLRENKTFPQMFRSLGWCTWDAFYHKVNEADILKKLQQLKDQQVPVRWMLIDDGWSDADYPNRKLKDWTADKEKFPQGLSHTVKVAKEAFGLEQVGVWHALMGYWTGLAPDSPIFRKWQDKLVHRGQDDVLEPREETYFDFYNGWHSYLADKCGIDFVKVDGQGSGSLYYKGMADYNRSAGGCLRALERSTDAHFGGNLVNCMGMAPENLWLRGHSPVARSSDDFVPQVPRGFREHALQNSFNTLLHGQFYWGDWDMFWSSHVESRQNSVLRAVSGGPVYISDPLDGTNPTNIMPLVGNNGRLLLCDDVGVPTADCLLTDPRSSKKLFKVFNRYGDGYVVAVFNLDEENETCCGTLAVEDIPQLGGKQWLVYRHFAGSCTPLEPGQPVELTLEAQDAELLLVLPRRPGGQILGDPAKYLSTWVVQSQQVEGNTLTAALAACESFLFATEKPVSQVLVNGRAVEVTPRAGCYQVPGDTGPMAVEIAFGE